MEIAMGDGVQTKVVKMRVLVSMGIQDSLVDDWMEFRMADNGME